METLTIVKHHNVLSILSGCLIKLNTYCLMT